MDYPENRKLYLQNFEEFVRTVELNDRFVNSLENHRFFDFYMKTIKDRSDERKKDFILLELTLARSTCTEIIKLLRESGQFEAADQLQVYNTSPGRMALSYEICIPVNGTDSPRVGSGPYDMTRYPRGKAIIINNVQKHLFNESKRFEHIFEELMFSVDLLFDLTAKQMVDKLEQIKTNMELMAKASKKSVKNTQPQAVVVMIISHGVDDKILGRPACKALENSDEKFDDSDDLVDISTIVNMFSDQNFKLMKQLPKIFFFTCCRNKSGIPPTNVLDQVELGDNNLDTFVCYSCSEGYRTYYDRDDKISYFGQVLSHSIAQYANQTDLAGIISRTNDLLLELSDGSGVGAGNFAAEARSKGLRRQLFFNPKWRQDS